jgi:Fic family protein
VQFETIHPFLDGNGRLGRLLITFLLCAEGALREPILYLSLYFKAHRRVYYDLLTRVRTEGNWETWMEFFLTGVKETSDQAVSAAQRIIALLEADRKQIESLGRAAASTRRVHQYAQTRPIFSIVSAAEQIGTTFPTVAGAVAHLGRLGIIREITGKQRRRLFAYGGYLDILNEGTEPLARQ